MSERERCTACTYSRAMNQSYPRKCTGCGGIEPDTTCEDETCLPCMLIRASSAWKEHYGRSVK